MYAGGAGGAHSRPMMAGSTKPPQAGNYIDSHGFNAGLGNAAHTKFPSVVETKPLQVMINIFMLTFSSFYGFNCKQWYSNAVWAKFVAQNVQTW